MCISKVHIPNPGFGVKPLAPQFIDVNCGKCWQCRLERSNSFAFRMQHEVLQPDTLPFFVTLTYSPDYLPIIQYNYVKDDEPHRGIISCWNRTHVQRFHKRIRRSLQYYFGIPSDSFKYLCTCERGSDDEYVDNHGKLRIATERPHYHLLYILYNVSRYIPIRLLPVSYYHFINTRFLPDNLSSFFQFLLKDKWFYGHVDNISYCREIPAATNYITKYITKSYGDRVFKLNLKQIYHFFDKDFDDAQARAYHGGRVPKPVSFSSLVPRSFSSINLGMSFLKDLSYGDLFDYLTVRKKVTLPRKRGASVINLPSYYFNRLCKITKHLHYNKYYAFNKVNKDYPFYCSRFTDYNSFSYRPTWDNVFGFDISESRRIYTSTFTTDFGNFVQRIRLVSSVKSLVNEYKHFLLNKSYYLFLYNSYHSLPTDFRSNVMPVTQSDIDSFSDIVFDRLFSQFLKLRSTAVKERSPYQCILSKFIDFIKLCHTTSAHLKHLCFQSMYINQLPSIALNNPDLLINHYF